MKTFIPSELPVPKLHQLLLGSVSPRPICFASTVDAEGNRNLAPFSFFNVFSANPPVVVFSPARSGRTGKTKDTFENCKALPEVVINMVSYDMVEQMSLASSPYAHDVDEFVKSGLTPVDADLVAPARVKEAPVQLECKVIEIKELGQNGGAGNLIICEVVKMHIADHVLDENEKVDPFKIDLVARMGGNYYCRANGDAVFEVPKPITTIGVGIDALPETIRFSDHLTGNELGKLGQQEAIPNAAELKDVPTMAFPDAIEKAKALMAKNASLEALQILIKNLPNE